MNDPPIGTLPSFFKIEKLFYDSMTINLTYLDQNEATELIFSYYSYSENSLLNYQQFLAIGIYIFSDEVFGANF